MMKKLAIFLFVTVLGIALALPAYSFTFTGEKGASFTIGGSLRYDIGYRHTDKDYNTNVNPIYGTDERTNFFSGLSQSTNIYGVFSMGDVSGNFVLTTQSSNEAYFKQNNDLALNSPYSTSSNSWSAFFNQKDNGFFDVVYGTYKFGNCSIQAGKLLPLLVVQAPAATLGYTLGAGSHIVGIAWGFIYDNKYPGIRYTQVINKNFNFGIQLIEPGTFAENIGPALGSTSIVLRESYAQFPAIAARVGLNFGPVSLNPGALYQQLKFNNLPSGYDDKVDSYEFRLPVRLTFGAFTALLEGVYGQNLGGGSSNSNVSASEPTYASYFRNSSGGIQNGHTLNGWIDLSYRIGPVTPHVYYGTTKSYNEDHFKGAASGDNDTRWFTGINAFWSITPNFVVVPEFSLYDLGQVPGLPVTVKLGQDWLAGIQFQFNF
jgi:hypothetical protein